MVGSSPFARRFCKTLLIPVLLLAVTAVAQADEKKLIVCSTTQVYDFTREIVGDRCEVRCVLSAGEDPHTYDPGNDDLLLVGKADLCIRNGWNLEGNQWMKSMADASGKKLVTCVTGIQPRDLKDHGKVVKDPHAWLTPANALKYSANIRDAVIALEPQYAHEFKLRFDLYRLQLLMLDQWMRETLQKIPGNQRVLITHHDAFGYFCDSFKFEAFSPVGWSTGELTEVSIAQKQAIVKQIRDRGVPAVFVETSTKQELVASIAKEAGVKVGEKLYSDAMGPADSAGETYLGMMRENVIRIVKGLAPKTKTSDQ